MNNPQGGRSPAIRVNLNRDNDRPLQFDGWTLAEIESAGSPITHRCAVYETRGGRFVTEFSTRPSKAQPHDIHRLKRHVIETVVNLAADVLDRAATYPDDRQLGMHGAALQSLVAEFDELESNAPQWSRFWLLYKGEDDDVVLEHTNVLKTFGVRGSQPRNGAEVLDELIDELMTRTGRDIANKRSTSKVAVHDTIDDALKSFRAGPLTTELLARLGRLEPEFIE